MANGATLSAAGVSVRFGGVTAVADVSIDARAVRSSASSGPTEPARRRCSTCSPASARPRPGASSTRAPTSRSAARPGVPRHGIRRTFQRQQMFGWLSVEDNVLVVLEWRGGGGGLLADLAGLPTRRRRERERRAGTDGVLELCGLLELRDQPVGKLPSGCARMVQMARDRRRAEGSPPRRADVGARGDGVA